MKVGHTWRRRGRRWDYEDAEDSPKAKAGAALEPLSAW